MNEFINHNDYYEKIKERKRGGREKITDFLLCFKSKLTIWVTTVKDQSYWRKINLEAKSLSK